MNRVERPDPLITQRPPRRWRVGMWMIIVILLTLGLFAGTLYFPFYAFQVKGFPGRPPAAVSTATARLEAWQPEIQIVGSLRPVRGADLSVEVPGVVDEVSFDSGGDVAAGAQILRLRDTDDVAKLHTLEAARDLAQTTFDRDRAQLDRMLIARAQFDVSAANLRSLQAQVAEQQAVIAKKTLRAPFAGNLGIRNVNAGQYVSPGVVVVTLQSLDPLFFDFSIPQQQLDQLRVGQSIAIKVDAYPAQNFSGRITTIDPKIDPSTRNVAVRATVPNQSRKLLPGMFATATLTTGKSERYITLPQTAITFNPFGNMVFLVQEQVAEDGTKSMIARQTIVTTGATRGDQIAILTGLKEGDEVVSAGQTTLQSGAAITVNNVVTPLNDPDPRPREQ